MEEKDIERITMEHGAGGEVMEDFIAQEIIPLFKDDVSEIGIEYLDDSAVINNVVFTIDGHTVKPVFFRGGDLGSLAVSGTVNDILAIGGQPVALSNALVIPEGYPVDKIRRILKSTARTAEKANVPVIAGDTKVVEKDDLDEPIMTTAGIGKKHPRLDKNLETAGGRKSRWLTDDNLNPGDKIIVSGTIGDHGITILSTREGYGFEGEIKSDVAPLVDVMEAALSTGGVGVAKDPTRGGLSNTLNEWSQKSKIGIEVWEDSIPLRNWVVSASDMLGIDPLNIGNEGKFILGVNSTKASDVLKALKKTENGKNAAIIGEVKEEINGVVLKTEVGGTRILEPPVGDPVPRIC
ncbi:MAG: hydrogenase expression/formation protein HypE [Thermoplasmata archaeon]